MLRVMNVLASGAWPSAQAADSVMLDFDDRHRRRLVMTGERGLRFLLDLPEAAVLRDGDGLVLEDGRIVRVRAAPERLAEIRCASAADLARVAWHLGNRHLPTQLLGDRLRIREDHVILDMVRRLGAEIQQVKAPFDPEGGAYGHAHGHEHSHGHHHDHEHARGQSHGGGHRHG